MQINNETLCVIYSSDDNYAQHMGASIYSLLKNNQDFLRIYIFIINNEISEENIERIDDISKKFGNAQIEWISFRKWKKQLELNMAWHISISSYARLFVGSMLSDEIEKILYLDCDMIVCSSLKELWKLDIESNIIAAVQDTVSCETKNAVDVDKYQPYFNAGLLLIDLKKWRKNDIEKKCLEYIRTHDGQVLHHDQGVLNGVLSKKIQRLPLKYNVMTIHYIFSKQKTIKYFGECAEFYDEIEIEKAVKKPVIIHFTPSFTCHPWTKGCCHPHKELYWEMLKSTAWKNQKVKKNEKKWYARLIEWKYRKSPF